jgi:phosphoglycerate dehydrogenase-like enzyme
MGPWCTRRCRWRRLALALSAVAIEQLSHERANITLIAADVAYRDWLRPIPDDVRLEWFETYEEALAATARAQVLLLGPNRGWAMDELIGDAERLRWVHTRAAGVDGSQLRPASLYRRRAITVTNGSGISSVPIAEFVVMAMLAVVKGLPSILSSQARAEWVKPSALRELRDSAILLIGFGDVGRATWDRLRPFGVRGTAVRRHRTSEEGIEIVGPDDWRHRLGEFDWILLTTPLTDETRHLIGSRELSEMNRNSWLINVSRGGVVDQRALLGALRRVTSAAPSSTSPIRSHSHQSMNSGRPRI